MYKSTKVHVVPWYSAIEFKEVYQQLYSPGILSKKQALDQISIWETRCHPSLPAAIDSSVAITTAIIQDNLYANSSSVVSHVDIQFIYSSAIIRFVNLTVDVHGNKTFSGSLSDFAKRLGIPVYIVDIRNEATHSVKPSLANLRLAAEKCMAYLKEIYWEIEACIMIDCTIAPTAKDMRINELIRHYANLKLQVIYWKNANLSNNEEVNSELEEILKEIRSKIRKKPKVFAEMLATNEFFIPCEDDFKQLALDEELLLYEDEYDESQDEEINGNKFACIPNIPIYHELLWSELINLLHSADAVPFFLECLLKSQNRKPKLGQKLIISWVNTILKIYDMGRHSNLKWIFKEKGIVVDWIKLFYAAVQSPCKYVPYVLNNICSHLNSKDTTSQILCHLAAMYLLQIGNLESQSQSNSFYTVEDIKTKKSENAEQEKGADDNIFFYPLDDCYSDWPLGHRHSTTEKTDEIFEEPDAEVSDIVEKIFLDDNKNDMDDYCDAMDFQSPNNYERDLENEFEKVEKFLYIF